MGHTNIWPTWITYPNLRYFMHVMFESSVVGAETVCCYSAHLIHRILIAKCMQLSLNFSTVNYSDSFLSFSFPFWIFSITCTRNMQSGELHLAAKTYKDPTPPPKKKIKSLLIDPQGHTMEVRRCRYMYASARGLRVNVFRMHFSVSTTNRVSFIIKLLEED